MEIYFFFCSKPKEAAKGWGRLSLCRSLKIIPPLQKAVGGNGFFFSQETNCTLIVHPNT